MHLAPGDIVSILIGEQFSTPEIEAAIRQEWGLDEPLALQYAHYLRRVLHGEFGRSYILNTDVAPLVLGQLWPTPKLTGASLAVTIAFAVGLAVLTAGRRWAGRAASGVELLLASTPSFWLGIMLLFVFSFTLMLFPVAGDRGFASLVLPALSLGLAPGAVIGRVLRQGIERALDEPYAGMNKVSVYALQGIMTNLVHPQLKAQAEALAQQAEEARLAELDAIISSIREQIAEYEITPEQLFGRRRAVASSPRAPIAPKYRDPKTGAMWSGRGKAPHWIANARNRDRFWITDAD